MFWGVHEQVVKEVVKYSTAIDRDISFVGLYYSKELHARDGDDQE
jgi:hypothetical protein